MHPAMAQIKLELSKLQGAICFVSEDKQDHPQRIGRDSTKGQPKQSASRCKVPYKPEQAP